MTKISTIKIQETIKQIETTIKTTKDSLINRGKNINVKV